MGSITWARLEGVPFLGHGMPFPNEIELCSSLDTVQSRPQADNRPSSLPGIGL